MLECPQVQTSGELYAARIRYGRENHGDFPRARVARDQEESSGKGEGPSLSHRLAGQKLAHRGHVQIRAFCARQLVCYISCLLALAESVSPS
jgi:hypothetical protein